MEKNPYKVILSRYHTEKAAMLQNLQHSTANRSVARCSTPKYIFIVDRDANKVEIAVAIEAIYAEKKVKVVAVNVIRVKPKQRRVRGRLGFTAGFKKAIVTLQSGNQLDENL